MTVPGHLQLKEIRLPPGEEWQAEGGTWRFLLVAEGIGYWLETSRPRSLNAGELLVAGPAAGGLARASQLDQLVLRGFSFAPEMLLGFFTCTERHFFEHGLATSAGEIQCLPSTHPLARRLAALTGQAGRDGTMTQRAELLALTISFFAGRMPESGPVPEHRVFVQSRFEELVGQMPDLELSQHTPEELARLCECSPRHFNRLFRERFGQSPRARLTELRLLKASHLLATSAEKIADIALASGYRSPSLFVSMFRRRFGMSPSQWRDRAAQPDPAAGDPSAGGSA